MVETDRKWAISCYIPVLNIITCGLTSVRKVNSKFCRFHARQGLVLFGFWILTVLIAFISQTLSLMLLGIALLLHGTGIFIAYSNSEAKIPIIGQIAAQIPEYSIFKILTGKTPEEQSAETTEEKKGDIEQTTDQERTDKKESTDQTNK